MYIDTRVGDKPYSCARSRAA